MIRTIRAKILFAIFFGVSLIVLVSGAAFWGTQTMSDYDDETASNYSELRSLLCMSRDASIYLKELVEFDLADPANAREFSSAERSWRLHLEEVNASLKADEGDEAQRGKDIVMLNALSQQIMKEGDALAKLTLADTEKAKARYNELDEDKFDRQFLSLIDRMIDRENQEVVERQQKDEALSVFISKALLIVVALALLGSLILSRWILGSIMTPIKRLTAGTEALAKGDLAYRILNKGSDELAMLSSHFDRMADQLQSATVKISEAKAKEETYRLQGEFLSIVSHELRAPLNATLGFAELISDEELSERQKTNLHQISHSSYRLLGLINDILDFSKLKAGRMNIYAETFHLPKLLHDVQQEAQVLARGRAIEVIVEVSEGLTEIKSDEMKVRQIVSNLVSNAIKFTETGSILIKAERTGAHRITLSVKDSGIGIPKDQQALIFEPFRQAEKAQSKGSGGTGLGLAIVSRLAELLGGEVSLQSELHKGSIFTVVLPEST